MSGIADTDRAQRHFGFVMEQTLGHVTHYKNMRTAIDQEPNVNVTWYPLGFAPRGGLETLPPFRGNWSARSSLRTRRLLARDRAARYDALFFHTQVTTLLSVPLMRRVPAVVSLDATPLNYDAVGAAYGHRASGGAAEAAKLWMNKRPLHTARALVTWCEWARRSLIDDYGIDGARVTVIAPGVDLDLWPRPTPEDSTGLTRVLFVGADFARKGGDDLLRAFTGLEDRCELHLVTKAPVEERRSVHVYRDVAPNSDLLKNLYATADLFALPTQADCFPLVIQEAMAAGLPVISTDVGAIGEAVRHGETGLLVPPGDAATLHGALDALAGDATKRRTLGACARVVAEQQYDSAANARRILDIMTRIVDEGELWS